MPLSGFGVGDCERCTICALGSTVEERSNNHKLESGNIGPIITFTMLRVPYSDYSIIYPKTLF